MQFHTRQKSSSALVLVHRQHHDVIDTLKQALPLQRNIDSFRTHSCTTLMGNDCLVTHEGGCHCGAVRFEFAAEANLVAWDCNCESCPPQQAEPLD